MVENANIITEHLNFKAKLKSCTISQYKECVCKYEINFDNAIKLKGDIPIFLDTNIILRYYSISFSAREKLYDFIKKNKHKIYLTPQIEIEFIKNREGIIQRYFEQVTDKIPKEFTTDILNKNKSFLEKHNVILKDFYFMETELKKSKSNFEGLLKKLNKEVAKKKKDNKDLILKDKFLDLLSSCNLIDGLNETEISIVKKDFDSLASLYKKGDQDTINEKNAFPGFGDIKEKPDDPYGDYIIYHELLKYLKENSTDIIFLTFDNTKGDWMKLDKSPHLKYITNAFNNTGNILYIVDADRTLKELLDVNIDSLISNLAPKKLNFSIRFSDFFDGMWRNTYIVNNNLVYREDFEIKEGNKYFVAGIHYFNIEELNWDGENNVLSFVKVAIQKDDNRRLFNIVSRINDNCYRGFENDTIIISYDKVVN